MTTTNKSDDVCFMLYLPTIYAKWNSILSKEKRNDVSNWKIEFHVELIYPITINCSNLRSIFFNKIKSVLIFRVWICSMIVLHRHRKYVYMKFGINIFNLNFSLSVLILLFYFIFISIVVDLIHLTAFRPITKCILLY